MTLFTISMINIFTLLLGALLIALSEPAGSVVLLVIGLVIVAGSVTFELLMHRCPHCRFYLRWRRSYCPYCGEEIGDDDKFYLKDRNATDKKD